ncbi:MAG: tetratricopeptide repeat protein [Bacteroidia bacterium]
MRQAIRNIMLFSLMAFASVSMHASDLEQRLIKGGALYDTEDYQGAIEVYQESLMDGDEDFALFYVLGNAHYRLDHIGEAVLYYEKAVKFAPHDTDANFNLHLARQRVQDRFAEAPAFFITRAWNWIRDFLMPDFWFWIGLVACCIACGIQAFIWYKKTDKRFKPAISSLVITGIALLTIAFGFSRLSALNNNAQAVLLSNQVSAKEAPDAQSGQAFVIHEGIKVSITDELNGWWQIELPDGRSAWVPTENWGRI